MAKIVFAKFNEDLAKKVLSKGATIPVVGKILGNMSWLSQTKNKSKIGLNDYLYSGRPAKGRPRIYYSKNEMNQDDLVYPIREMNDFNTRLANELFYFHLFGYAIKDLEYERNHKIARITFIEMNDDNSCDEFSITFLDLSEVRYLKVSKEYDSTDKNLFILPMESGEDLENVAVAQEQKALLNLSSDDFSVVVATTIGKTEYYEINEHGGSIFRSHSFLKRCGEYANSIFKYDTLDDQNSQLIDYQIFDDNRKAQLTANGFAMKDGRIVELDNQNSNLSLDDFKIYLLDQFKDEYVIANRYFEKRYLSDPSLDTSTIDQIMDDIAKDLDPKSGLLTFAELETSKFFDFVEEQEDESNEDAQEDDPSGRLSELFEGKTQGEQNDKVQTGKLDDTPSSTEHITPISGKTEDKDLPESHENVEGNKKPIVNQDLSGIVGQEYTVTNS